MTDTRRRRSWHRAGSLAALAAFAVVASAQGCSSDPETTMGSSSSGTGGGAASSSATTSTTGTGGVGGSGGSTGGSGGISGLSTAADSPVVLDATPDPTGKTIYFTGVDPTGGPGVFSAPADGSAAVKTVKVGAPFAAPFGIAIGTDGNQLYIADPGATDPTSKKDLGIIFALPVGGGTPTALSGSELTEPRSLEITKEGGVDVIYFTGRDKTDGAVGVFKMPASGGAITVVAKGDPFRDPSGVAVASDGTLYVADTIASISQKANIIKVTKAGVASTFLQNLTVGYPCGVALSKDEKTLLISALDPVKKTDALLQVDLGTMVTSVFTTGIDTFSEAAGLHRAHDVNVYAWADSSASATGPNKGGGKVFVGK